VRLKQGRHGSRHRVQPRSGAQAHAFETQGFKHLHVVDLDGAFAGKPDETPPRSDRILETVGLCVQLGGGIRDMATIEGWLEKGVNRVIIGNCAVRNPALVKEAAKKFPKRVAVGLDAKDGKVAVDGWAETSGIVGARSRQALRRRRRRRHHLHRRRPRRHAQGINWDATIALADAISIPVVASGGLASIEDVKVLTEPAGAQVARRNRGRAL